MSDATPKTQTQPQASRALMPVQMTSLGLLQPSNLQEAVEVARLIAHSGLVPKQFEGNPGSVLVAIQMGAEIGLSPMASIQGIAVINGRPSLWGDALLAVVMSHPDCEDVVEDFDTQTMTATCVVKRRGRKPVARSFSAEEAKTAGLWSKGGPWSSYPRRMLAMRARGFALRDSFPDALRGVRMVEEERDVLSVTPEGAEVIAPPAAPAARFGFTARGEERIQREASAKPPAPDVVTLSASVPPAAAPEPVTPAPAQEPPAAPAKAQEKPAAKPAPASSGAKRGDVAADFVARVGAMNARDAAVELAGCSDPALIARVGNEDRRKAVVELAMARMRQLIQEEAAEAITKTTGEVQGQEEMPWDKHLDKPAADR